MTDDDRAEQAFRDALAQHAADPGFQPLQLPAPRKRNWNRWLPAAAAVVLVAAIAIPLLIGRMNGAGGTSAAPMQAPEATSVQQDQVPTPTAGWRWESYRGLTYQVPWGWDYDSAPRSDWCTDSKYRYEGPFVDQVPDFRTVADVACRRDIRTARMAMFASVQPVDSGDRGWDLPAGWSVLASSAVDGYRVEVVYPDAQVDLAQRIVASVRPLPEVDANGCPAAPELATNAGAVPPRQPGVRFVSRVSVCQYDLNRAPALLASRTESVSVAVSMQRELDEAPVGVGPDDAGCSSTGDSAVLVRLWAADGQTQDVYVRYSGCQGNGIFDGTTSRTLTMDVCGAVLAPPAGLTSATRAVAKVCPWGEVPKPSPAPTPSKTR